jgi:polyisoprenoid-binding protein YceI
VAPGAVVSGTLTVRETTKPISFPVTVIPSGAAEIVLDATVEVDRSDFGLTWNQLGMASMKNTITVHARFTKD